MATIPLSAISKIKKSDVFSERLLSGIIGDSIAFQRSGVLFRLMNDLGIGRAEMRFAVGGSQIDDMPGQFATFLSKGCEVCLMQVGGNNATSTYDRTLAYDEYKAIFDLFEENGIRPIITMIQPHAIADSHYVSEINIALYMACKKYGYTLYNPWDSYFMVSGGWDTGKTTDEDQTHPVQSVRSEAGGFLVDLVKDNKCANLLAADSTSGMLLNPCFATDSNADGVSDNWTSSPSPYVTFTREADGANGRYFQCITMANNAASASGAVYQNVDGLVAGHQIFLSLRAVCESTDDLDTEVWTRVQIFWKNSGGTTIATTAIPVNPTIGENYIETIRTVPTDAVTARVWIDVFGGSAYAGTFKLKIGQVLFWDLTAQGISDTFQET